MRKTVAALFVTLVAMLGIWVPSVSAAYVSNAKVVIIVGAVHGQTDSYRDRGDAAYAEAKKYTPNVTKVYSPNATWSKVKSATTNANIVIYMGHGNGWPSPYTYDPNYTTKDGFGLNATAGNGDYNVKYYGEPYVDDLDLAPNAIILLHHLCYASGNSEPGKAEPTVSTAKQRATNYAAGFLRSPARAVIADGHMGAAYYLRGLFTTNQSILSLWRNAPNYNGNEFSFASTRNAGRTVYMDPDSPTKSFYRSLVLKPTLTTRDVTGVVADTGVDPATFVVPGRASVGAFGAELLADETGIGRRRAHRRDAPQARLAAQLGCPGRRGRVRGGGSRRRIDHRLRPLDAAHPARQRGAGRGHRRRGADHHLTERRRLLRHDRPVRPLLRDRGLDPARHRGRRHGGPLDERHRPGAGRHVGRPGRRGRRGGRNLHVHVPRPGCLAERAGAGRQVRHGQGRHDAAGPVRRRPGGRRAAVVLAERRRQPRHVRAQGEHQ